MEDNRTKIVYVNGTESNPLFSRMYEALKSYGTGENEFNRHGRIYDSIKKLFNRIKGNSKLENFVFGTKEIEKDIRDYEVIKLRLDRVYLRSYEPGQKQNKKRKL